MKVKCIADTEFYVLDKVYDVKIEDVYLYYIDDYWVHKKYFIEMSVFRNIKLDKLLSKK